MRLVLGPQETKSMCLYAEIVCLQTAAIPGCHILDEHVTCRDIKTSALQLTYTDKLGDQKDDPHREEAALKPDQVKDHEAVHHTAGHRQHHLLQDLKHQVGDHPVQAVTLLAHKDWPLQHDGLQKSHGDVF